jgi:hypothetical protein
MRRIIGSPGRPIGPVSLRQQKVDLWRTVLQQAFVGPHRVVVEIDRAEDSREQLSVLWSTQLPQGPGDELVAAAPVAEAAVPVVRLAVAVEADAHPEGMRAQYVEQGGVEPDAVRLNGHVHRRAIPDRPAHARRAVGDRRDPREERFTAV